MLFTLSINVSNIGEGSLQLHRLIKDFSTHTWYKQLHRCDVENKDWLSNEMYFQEYFILFCNNYITIFNFYVCFFYVNFYENFLNILLYKKNGDSKNTIGKMHCRCRLYITQIGFCVCVSVISHSMKTKKKIFFFKQTNKREKETDLKWIWVPTITAIISRIVTGIEYKAYDKESCMATSICSTTYNTFSSQSQ